jgi:hypothetical protein
MEKNASPLVDVFVGLDFFFLNKAKHFYMIIKKKKKTIQGLTSLYWPSEIYIK